MEDHSTQQVRDELHRIVDTIQDPELLAALLVIARTCLPKDEEESD